MIEGNKKNSNDSYIISVFLLTFLFFIAFLILFFSASQSALLVSFLNDVRFVSSCAHRLIFLVYFDEPIARILKFLVSFYMHSFYVLILLYLNFTFTNQNYLNILLNF